MWSDPLFHKGVSVKNRNKIVNCVDSDEMAHFEPSHQDLHCLQNNLYALQGRNGKKITVSTYQILGSIEFCRVEHYSSVVS